MTAPFSRLGRQMQRLLSLRAPARPGDGAAIVAPLDGREQRPSDLAQDASTAPSGPPDAALLDALTALERQIGRAGREQFKATALAEAQLERLTSVLDTLRAEAEGHAAEVARLREQNKVAEIAARREVVRALLPALDGLDAALRAGQGLLDRPAAHSPAREPVTWLRRLLGDPEPPAPPSGDETLRADLRSWLVGLGFVHQRLLAVLATEGVTPIAAEGQPFDPHLHVALEVTPAGEALPPGTVAAELRRGYLLGDRVLRHAEVAVAQGGQSS